MTDIMIGETQLMSNLFYSQIQLVVDSLFNCLLFMFPKRIWQNHKQCFYTYKRAICQIK